MSVNIRLTSKVVGYPETVRSDFQNPRFLMKSRHPNTWLLARGLSKEHSFYSLGSLVLHVEAHEHKCSA